MLSSYSRTQDRGDNTEHPKRECPARYIYAQPARDGELRADGSPGLFVDLLNECRRHAWIEAEKRRVAHACKTWSTLAIVGQAPQGLDQEIGRIEISEQLVRRRVCATAANILGLRRSTRARA